MINVRSSSNSWENFRHQGQFTVWMHSHGGSTNCSLSVNSLETSQTTRGQTSTKLHQQRFSFGTYIYIYIYIYLLYIYITTLPAKLHYIYINLEPFKWFCVYWTIEEVYVNSWSKRKLYEKETTLWWTAYLKDFGLQNGELKTVS